ncbi:unnamed protein product [Nesidiocoris tenuis]|uniref:Uncharacterized protein n=1 Tax=Nesidiocoris tenuis TaxID=355587 RepID=A0A6H5HII4_9HEMI|nr:unnamed protein product [Nesidiocoris tenuis]
MLRERIWRSLVESSGGGECWRMVRNSRSIWTAVSDSNQAFASVHHRSTVTR